MSVAEFEALNQWMATATETLSPDQRKKLIRTIGAEMAKRTRKRMTAQKAPTGQKWIPRQKKEIREDERPPRSDRGRRNPNPQKGNKPLRFRYHGRTIHLKHYRHKGRRVIGFDPSSGGVRSFIVGEKVSKAKGPKMMRTLKKRNHLTIRSTMKNTKIGWFGRDVKLATIHHEGGRQQLQWGLANYPARPLIGLTTKDEQHIKEIITAFLAEVMNP